MPGPGRPRKEKSPPEDRLFKLSMREYMEKQNLLAHALTVQHEMTSNQLQASIQQMGVISEAMTQLQSSTKSVLQTISIGENYDMFDYLPAIAKLLKQDKTLIGNPLGASLGPLSLFSKATPGVKEKKKRNRKPKHPDAPKQPITAYFLFLEANRDRIRAELPADTPAGAIQKRGTDLWNELPEAEKEVYKAAYRENFKKYKEEMKQWEDYTGEPPAQPNGVTAAADGSDGSDDSDSTTDSDDSDAAPTASGGQTTAVPPAPVLAPAPAPAPPAPPPVVSAPSKPIAPAKNRKNVPSNLIDPALTSTATSAQGSPLPASVPAPAKDKKGSKENKKNAKEQPAKEESPEESKKKRRRAEEGEKAEKKRKRKEAYGDDY